MLLIFKQLISPKPFVRFSNRLLPWLALALFILLPYGILSALYFSPPDAVQGDGYRMIYVHVPCAFLSIFIYSVMASSAALSLIFRLKLTTLIMKESISIGALFTFLALITGSIWGKPMWGTYWMWDARLTSELILLFLYLGILLFQKATAHTRTQDTRCAILILVGFIDIPIIHYSVTWWNTLHQGATLKLFQSSFIDKTMLYPLLAMVASALIYYAIVLCLRIRSRLIFE